MSQIDLETPRRKPSLWERYQPLLGGLAVGLVVGPLLSAYLGWQVTPVTVQKHVQRAVVRQQTAMCEMLARRDHPDTTLMDYTERRDLAEEYGTFPWNDAQQYTVINDCAAALGKTQSADGTAS